MVITTVGTVPSAGVTVPTGVGIDGWDSLKLVGIDQLYFTDDLLRLCTKD